MSQPVRNLLRVPTTLDELSRAMSAFSMELVEHGLEFAEHTRLHPVATQRVKLGVVPGAARVRASTTVSTLRSTNVPCRCQPAKLVIAGQLPLRTGGAGSCRGCAGSTITAPLSAPTRDDPFTAADRTILVPLSDVIHPHSSRGPLLFSSRATPSGGCCRADHPHLGRSPEMPSRATVPPGEGEGSEARRTVCPGLGAAREREDRVRAWSRD